MDSNIFLGIATFVLAAVTVMSVFGDSIRYLLGLRPRLVLTLHTPKGTLDNVSGNPNEPRSAWSRYYHLRLINENERWPATNVRVVVLRVMKPIASGRYADVQLHGPLQLYWQLATVHPLYETVGPDIHCDLGYVRKEEGFTLTPIAMVSPFEGTLPSAGTMIVFVQALADKTKSNLLRIKIAWDGEWREETEEMASHLVVEPLKDDGKI